VNDELVLCNPSFINIAIVTGAKGTAFESNGVYAVAQAARKGALQVLGSL